MHRLLEDRFLLLQFILQGVFTVDTETFNTPDLTELEQTQLL